MVKLTLAEQDSSLIEVTFIRINLPQICKPMVRFLRLVSLSFPAFEFKLRKGKKKKKPTTKL